MSISKPAMPLEEGGSHCYVFSYCGHGYLSSHDAGPFLKPKGSVFERWNLKYVAADSGTEGVGGKILLSRGRDNKHYSWRHFNRGIQEKDKLEVLHAGYATVLSSVSGENVIVPVVSFRDGEGRSLRLDNLKIRVGFNKGGDNEYANECLWMLLTEPILAGAIDTQTRMIAACSAGVLGTGVLGIGCAGLAIVASAASSAAATAAVTAAAVDAAVATTTAVGAASIASATTAGSTALVGASLLSATPLTSTAVGAAAAVSATSATSTAVVGATVLSATPLTAFSVGAASVASATSATAVGAASVASATSATAVGAASVASATTATATAVGAAVTLTTTAAAAGIVVANREGYRDVRGSSEAKEDGATLLPKIGVLTFAEEQTAKALTLDAFIRTESFSLHDMGVVECLAKLLRVSQYSEEKLRTEVTSLKGRLAKKRAEDCLTNMAYVLGADPRPDLLDGLLDNEKGALPALLLQIVAQIPMDSSVSDMYVERSMVTVESANAIRIFALHPTLEARKRRSP